MQYVGSKSSGTTSRRITVYFCQTWPHAASGGRSKLHLQTAMLKYMISVIGLSGLAACRCHCSQHADAMVQCHHLHVAGLMWISVTVAPVMYLGMRVLQGFCAVSDYFAEIEQVLLGVRFRRFCNSALLISLCKSFLRGPVAAYPGWKASVCQANTKMQ